MDYKTKNLIDDEKARLSWDKNNKRPRVFQPVKLFAFTRKNSIK